MNRRTANPYRLHAPSAIPLLISLLLLPGLGCTGHHRAYPGKARPPAEVAVLIVPKQTSPRMKDQACLQITKFDAYSKPTRAQKDGTVHLEILPGPHDITTRLKADEWNYIGNFQLHASLRSERQAVLRLHALPNHTYYLVAVFGYDRWSAIIREGNAESGPIVARISRFED